MLCDFIAYQEWTSFFDDYQVYYPHLVQEFYGNLHKEDENLVTLVHDTQITVRPSMFSRELDIPAFRATLNL